jgi:3-hydroxyacyl-CoA dehydrogenase/enoyl-CoA hydratase/carnithine racemase
MDTPGSAANVLTEDLFRELDDTFSSLQSRTDLVGLILFSAKPKIFVAGADLRRIQRTLDWPDDQIMEFCEAGRAVMARLSQTAFPTVAAIHGASLGGGLEVALWCDFRIATDDARTVLGLPEVKLGLIPGWAGTVRLPRMIGLGSALDLITTGRPISAKRAAELGFIDRLSTVERITADSIELIDREQAIHAYRDRRRELLGPARDRGDAVSLRAKYMAAIAANVEIHSFACEVALDHMLESAEMSHDEACRSESRAMARVYGSEPSHGLLNNFFLTEHNKKSPGFVDVRAEGRRVSRVGIVGAGQMGGNIARACLRFANSVKVLDVVSERAAAIVDTLRVEFPEANISAAVDYRDFHDCDLVLESIVESEVEKKAVLQRLEQAVSREAVLASNTSSISIERLGESLAGRDRFCGIHFCHPQLMALVEVVRAAETCEETVATAISWVRNLGKTPVAVKDRPGFVVNRLLAAMLDRAFGLYLEGYAIPQIDGAVREFGFRGGPFEIVDVIGADVCMLAGRTMWEGRVNAVSLNPILPRMVKHGWLGRKSKRGFYFYEFPDGQQIWSADVDNLLASYRAPDARPRFSDEQIAHSILSAVVLEASYILDDGCVADYRDIDLCIINGISFPAYRGGILLWADRFGIGKVIETLKGLSKADPRWAPNAKLLGMQERVERFYHVD